MVLASPWLVVTPDATLRVFIHEAFWGGCRGSIFEDGRAFLRMQQQHSEVTNGQVGTQIARALAAGGFCISAACYHGGVGGTGGQAFSAVLRNNILTHNGDMGLGMEREMCVGGGMRAESAFH